MPVNMWRCSGTTVHKPDSGSRGPVSRPKWVIMLGRALELVTVPLYTLRYKWVQVNCRGEAGKMPGGKL